MIFSLNFNILVKIVSLNPLNKKRHILIVLLALFALLNAVASDGLDINPDMKGKGRKQKKSWILGVGWNAVDDNGTPFKKLFALRKAWNIPWYPSQLSAEILGDEGWAWGGIFNFNMYKGNKIINGTAAGGSFPFISIDAFAKYHLNNKLNIKKRYDPYIPMGAGYTLRFIAPYRHTIMVNFGLGINIWMTPKIGLNLQTMAKFGCRSPFIKTGSNYLQHSGGLVYMIDNTTRKKHSMTKPRYKWVHDTRYVK